MKPGERHVISINANYGHYQLVIGPSPAREKAASSRPIEISGEIHHLFVSPRKISPYPTQNQVTDNLKDTVIMRGLSIHLRDPQGDGSHLAEAEESNGMHAREYINLAGKDGDHLIKEVQSSSTMRMEAYHIIQRDILNALKEHKKESLESVE